MNYNRFVKLALFLLVISCASTSQRLYYASWNQNLSIAKTMLDKGKKVEAILYLEEALVSLEKSYKPSYLDIATTNRFLGSANEKNKKYKKAISYYLIALDNFEKIIIESMDQYSIVLYRLGLNYRRIGDFDKSIYYLKKRLEIIESNQGIKTEDYANTLNSISISYKRQNNYDKALKYNKTSIDIIKSLKGEKSPEYFKKLSNLNQIYWELSQFDKAIPLQKRALSLFPESDKNSISYAIALQTMSLLYNGTNEYLKEIDLLNEVIEILNKIPNYKEYIVDINTNLAVAYDNLGNYEKSITLIKDVIENTSIESEKYPRRLQNLAYYYSELGEFDKALSIYDEALISCKNILGTKNSKYAQLIDAIGQLYLKKGDFLKSIEFFEEALTIVEGIEDFEGSHSEYGFYLNNYARSLTELERYDEAIEILTKNISISESDSIIDKERYYRKKHNLSKAFIKTNRYREALNLLYDFKDDYKNQIGEMNADYGQLLKSIGKAHIGALEYKKSIPFIDSSNRILTSQIDKVFRFRSERENKEFIKTVIPDFDELQSMSLKKNKINEQLIEINLNNQLLLKNLLLSQSIKIADKLLDSKDSTILNSVYRYKKLKSLISKNYSLIPSERSKDFDSLRDLLNEKEVELTKLYNNKYGNSTSLIRDWRIAKKSLKGDEVAIEFSNYRDSDSTYYIAYVYKRNWEIPKIISLFEETDLKVLLNNKSPRQLFSTRGSKAKSVINLKDFNDLIIKPLESDLKGVNTIYFSPSGILNQVPFAAIPVNDKQRFIDRYNLIRLSTTGKIPYVKKNSQPDEILFFGGIIYDSLSKKEESLNLNIKELEAFKTSNSNLGNNKFWEYLPATLTEIQNIKSQFDKHNKISKIIKGKAATEEEFKKYDGDSPKIIHIATHGYFYENIKDNASSVKLDSLNVYYYAEDPLLRSGLILAGGNYSWNNGIDPYEKEDGVLTAMEISNLNLSNTSLVVLSACETGLGDIDGSEGVYGLQRAFKMAGVDLIIMSLWEVPDKETSEFMQLFYDKWLNGLNIRLAFNETQRAMSRKYAKNPEKWAAFVLFE